MKNKRLEILICIPSILIVGIVVIPFIIAALAQPSIEEMQEGATQHDIRDATGAVSNFVSDCSDISLLEEDLDRLCVNKGNLPGWNGPYVEYVEEINDVWDNPLKLVCSTNDYMIISAGVDGEYFTEDDIKGEKVSLNKTDKKFQPPLTPNSDKHKKD